VAKKARWCRTKLPKIFCGALFNGGKGGENGKGEKQAEVKKVRRRYSGSKKFERNRRGMGELEA